MIEPHTREIMSKKLITIRYEVSLRTAYQVMNERKIRHLPVTDEKEEIIGILSDRDLQRAMSPSREVLNYTVTDPEFDNSFQVKHFMSWPVKTVTDSDPVEEVARRMLKEKVSAFLVHDRHGLARGIVTTDDLIKLLIRLLEKDPHRIKHSLDSMMDEINFSAGNWAAGSRA